MNPHSSQKPIVAIIDYNLGNLFSVVQACKFVGFEPIVTFNKDLILSADAIIIPGVGAFGDAMMQLKKFDIIEVLKDFISSGKTVLGICLGMQLLFSESEEFGNHSGLGIIKGSIKRFPEKYNEKKLFIPQIQWNQIFYPPQINSWNKTLLNRIKMNEYMYFIHSYYAIPDHSVDVLCATSYEGFEYCSGIIRDNIIAVQFHPEKSGIEGLKIYQSLWDKVVESRNYE
jgi:glutamine amidotransferase